MPPVGNVVSIEDAFSKLDGGMCTRGNIGIDTLIHGTPEEVTALVNHIMEEAIKEKRRHMVAASDYLLPQCKEENVRALCDAVRNYYRA
jgi:uroporphyrinogen-III decarboxylase